MTQKNRRILVALKEARLALQRVTHETQSDPATIHLANTAEIASAELWKHLQQFHVDNAPPKKITSAPRPGG